MIFILRLLLPVLPALMAVLFVKKHYLLNYKTTLAKLNIHLSAISQGPVQHYFEDILRFKADACEPVQGHCSQCGNCCLNRQCVFLEQSSPDIFICGIYTSPLRRFSNCSTFPLNGHDIARYQCPTFTVSTSTQAVYKLQQI